MGHSPEWVFPPLRLYGRHLPAVVLGKRWGQEGRGPLASERQWEGDHTVPRGTQTKCSFTKLWSEVVASVVREVWQEIPLVERMASWPPSSPK